MFHDSTSQKSSNQGKGEITYLLFTVENHHIGNDKTKENRMVNIGKDLEGLQEKTNIKNINNKTKPSKTLSVNSLSSFGYLL